MRELAGTAAIVGGLIWMTTVIQTALRPEGVPGWHRSTLDLHPLMLVAFVLIASAATKLASDLRPGRLAWAGAAVTWLGVAVFSVNVAFILATGDDRVVWPTHYGGFFVVALGLAVLGLAALRRRVIAAGLAAVMLAPPVLMPFGNAQDERVLLWLPLGFASVTLGIAVLARRHPAHLAA